MKGEVKTIQLVGLMALAVIMGALVGAALNQTKTVSGTVEGINQEPQLNQDSNYEPKEVTSQVKEVTSQAAPAGGGSCGGACGNPSCGGASGGSCGCGG
ncbi:MAG: hypothetical protein ABH851_01585 [Methanobacteriota archaeon]